MEAIRLKALTTELGGRCQGEDALIEGVAIDSRAIQPGDLFVALPGDSVDGHEFVAAAAQAGASAALVERFVDADLPQWCVDNPRRLLIEIACRSRSRSQATVIGLTGSNGKTTVKEMLASIFGQVGSTLATEGNRNNELGVPLTLCRLNPENRFAVIEMGCGQPGDIALLASWARPQIGLVNNAGPAHLARFGSLEAIARCKGELFEALPSGAEAIINADDAFAAQWEQQAAHCHIQRFSLHGRSAEVSGERLGNGVLRIRLPSAEVTVQLPLSGAHNCANALAAASAANAAGVGAQAIKAGLEAVTPVAGRLQTLPGPCGSDVIDDSYNANPASLAAALETLADGSRPLWLVLGDMAELGEQAADLHAEAGQLARERGVDRLYTLGPLAAKAAEAFGHPSAVYTDHNSLIDALQAAITSNVQVLIKGSRSAAMERVVAGLVTSSAREDAACF